MLTGRPLTDNVALVTGASSGIGAATAQLLADHGATVVFAARRRAELERLVKSVASNGGRARALEVDVADDVQVAAGVREVAAEFGRLDILVNSAGVMLSARVAIAELTDWRRMIEINLLGLMNVSRHAFPIMAQQGRGHIVNISSVSGRLANVGSAGYAATKSAVDTFTESLRKEGSSQGVRVTLVMPGITETEIFSHLNDEAVKARFLGMLEKLTPLQPHDVAAAVVYAVTQPPHVSASEIVLRPTQQLE